MFAGLMGMTPTATRSLYFSESASQYFITVTGATPTLFNPNNPPSIVTTQGSVEQWTVSNQTTEVHDFHIHQIHFLLLAVNGVAVPPSQQQFLDTVQIPAWSGTGPYPSVTLLMDFRGLDVGDFVYHCHILLHEDNGMMAIIRVIPPVQINAGGPAVSPFVADTDFSGGSTIDHANTINTSNVTNPAPAAVYQSARVGATQASGVGAPFTYTIPGFTPGTTYTVRLHFAETFFTTAGSRVFDVSINGTQVLTNFDIVAASGGENIANIQQFMEPANASGQFVITFTSVTNNALISGIEIQSGGTSGCTAPTTPTGLGATAVSSSQIDLSWSASTSTCVPTYNIYRSTSPSFTPSSSNEIASGVPTTTYSDTGLTASTTYYYLLVATTPAGMSAASNQASATTASSGPTCAAAPTAPSGAAATATSSSQISLSWTASTAGTGCSITYTVFRSTTSGFTAGSGNQIASGLTTTSFSDTGLAASTTYYYLVEGVDSAGSSAASNQASATTSALSGSCTSICIDSGSTTTVSPFVADEDFSGGNTIDHANTINTSKVTNPAPAAVYQTARDAVTAPAGGAAPGTTFSYTIGGFTANSSHTVRLHFAETFFTTAGSRVFNVTINGTQVLTNFDIEKTAGGENIANIQQFTEAANASGQYVITFVSVTNNALISGIEID
jgi:hypothetical protein